MWIDRETYPGKPLFNARTERWLPMYILLAESRDNGETRLPWRIDDLPDDIGPASMRDPIMRLLDNILIMSIETTKH